MIASRTSQAASSASYFQWATYQVVISASPRHAVCAEPPLHIKDINLNAGHNNDIIC